jgi:hypothetical protein
MMKLWRERIYRMRKAKKEKDPEDKRPFLHPDAADFEKDLPRVYRREKRAPSPAASHASYLSDHSDFDGFQEPASTPTPTVQPAQSQGPSLEEIRLLFEGIIEKHNKANEEKVRTMIDDLRSELKDKEFSEDEDEAETAEGGDDEQEQGGQDDQRQDEPVTIVDLDAEPDEEYNPKDQLQQVVDDLDLTDVSS